MDLNNEKIQSNQADQSKHAGILSNLAWWKYAIIGFITIALVGGLVAVIIVCTKNNNNGPAPIHNDPGVDNENVSKYVYISLPLNVHSMVYKQRNYPYTLDTQQVQAHSDNCPGGTISCENWCATQADQDYCQKGTSCWKTSHVQCWGNTNHHVLDSDSQKLWKQISHPSSFDTTAGSDSRKRWAHLRSGNEDLILFNSGQKRILADIVNQIQSNAFGVRDMLNSIPKSNKIIMTGFSEGAGWSFAVLDFINENKDEFPQDVYLVCGGPLVIPDEKQSLLDPEKHVVLIYGKRPKPDWYQTPGHTETDIVWDTDNKMPAHPNVKFPESRTTIYCDNNNKCHVNKVVDLEREYQYNQHNIKHWKINGEIHKLGKYRECIRPCVEQHWPQ